MAGSELPIPSLSLALAVSELPMAVSELPTVGKEPLNVRSYALMAGTALLKAEIEAPMAGQQSLKPRF